MIFHHVRIAVCVLHFSSIHNLFFPFSLSLEFSIFFTDVLASDHPECRLTSIPEPTLPVMTLLAGTLVEAQHQVRSFLSLAARFGFILWLTYTI